MTMKGFRRFAVLALLALVGCASVPAKPVVPVEDPAKTPISVIGVFECGKFEGLLVITKDGVVHPENVTLEQAVAIAKAMPSGTAGTLNFTGECAPKQST